MKNSVDISFSDLIEKNNKLIEIKNRIMNTINQLPCGPIEEKYLIAINL